MKSYAEVKLNVKQASELLGITRDRIYRLNKQGVFEFESTKSGSAVRKMIDWKGLESLASHCSESRAPLQNTVKVFSNLKGGVGKTTIVTQLAMLMSLKGYRVLVIDLDPQAHSTLSLGIPLSSPPEYTMGDLLTGGKDETSGKKIEFSDVVVKISPLLDLVPSSLDLSRAERVLHLERRGWDRFEKRIGDIRKGYDLVLIDTPPSSGILNINAFLAADELMLVVATDYMATAGLSAMFELLKELEEDFENFEPDVTIVPNLFDSRESIAREALGHMQSRYSDLMAETLIRKNVDLKEAQKVNSSIWLHKRKSYGSEDLHQLCDEIIGRNAEGEAGDYSDFSSQPAKGV